MTTTTNNNIQPEPSAPTNNSDGDNLKPLIEAAYVKPDAGTDDETGFVLSGFVRVYDPMTDKTYMIKRTEA